MTIKDVDQGQAYDDFAMDYHLLLADWENDLRKQARILDHMLKQHAAGPVQTVLDCMCGIGTQCIGLAELGYCVTGTDISGASITRAGAEAGKQGLTVDFRKADVRALEQVVPEKFDAVICCDNSLPALLSEEDVHVALTNMRRRLNPAGLCIIGIRKYDQILSERKTFHFRHLHEDNGRRILVFDLWEYPDDRFLKCNVFYLTEEDQGWAVTCRPLVFLALQQSDMKRLLKAAGFTLCAVVSDVGGNNLQFDHYICRAD